MKTVLVGLLLCCVSALDLPSNFPKCKRTDSKLEECIKSAYDAALPIFDKGLPEFKLSTILPLSIESLTVGEGSGPVQVVQHYENVEIHNLEKTNAKSVQATITDDVFKLTVEAYGSNVRMDADYELNGFIMIFPIIGKGRCSIENVTILFDMIGEVLEKKGDKYVELKTFTITLIPKLVTLRFDNLFGGDSRMGDEMNYILNENWEDIFHDVKHGYEDGAAQAIKKIVNTIFKQIPYNNLFPL